MATNRVASDPAAFEADVIHQQLGALTDASRQRHRLVPGSPEYAAALEIEERIAEHVWQLATEPRLRGSRPAGGEPELEN